MRIASTSGADTVVHDGETYTADDDGIVEVPQHVGEELTAFPDWLPEHVAADRAAAEKAAADNDITRLAARVAELEAWRASLEADDTDDEPEAAPKRTRNRKNAPAEPAESA